MNRLSAFLVRNNISPAHTFSLSIRNFWIGVRLCYYPLICQGAKAIGSKMYINLFRPRVPELDPEFVTKPFATDIHAVIHLPPCYF